jgi:hypothetical protein
MDGKGRILGRELYFAFIRVVNLYSLYIKIRMHHFKKVLYQDPLAQNDTFEKNNKILT